MALMRNSALLITKTHWVQCGERNRHTRGHGQGKTKLIGEKILCGYFAHVYAHSHTATVLQIPNVKFVIRL